MHQLTAIIGALPDLVLELGPHQYLLENHPQRLPQTDYSNYNPIRFCFRVVPMLRIPSSPLSSAKDCHSDAERRYSIP